jgi:hypothetical protein
VGQAVGEFAVIGEQEQALRLGVEPAHVEEALALVLVLQEVADAAAALRVLHGGDDAAGLVEDVVLQVLVELEPDAVDVDGSLRRVHADAEFRDDGAVDLHPPVEDHLLAHAARGDAGEGHDLLQAYALGVVDVDLVGRAAGALGPGGSHRSEVLAEPLASEGLRSGRLRASALSTGSRARRCAGPSGLAAGTPAGLGAEPAGRCPGRRATGGRAGAAVGGLAAVATGGRTALRRATALAGAIGGGTRGPGATAGALTSVGERTALAGPSCAALPGTVAG